MKRSTVYKEPADYFPKEIRKAAKIGEYAEGAKKAPAKKSPAKSTKKK